MDGEYSAVLRWKRKKDVIMKQAYFPLFVDISEAKIVVIGGGRIATRRVETLLKFAGDIQVVAPEITEEIKKFAESGMLHWTKDVYHAGFIDGARLVLAAADNKCNEQVAADCRERGIPVNVSHKKELCDFYFPAVAVRGNLVAGLTASGMDHAQARRAREKVEEAIDSMN